MTTEAPVTSTVKRRRQHKTATVARQLEARAVDDRELALRLYQAGQFANADALLLLAEDGFHAAKLLAQGAEGQVQP